MASGITEKFESMEYGPAAEDASEVNRWLDGHGRQFGHFIGGVFTMPGDDTSSGVRLFPRRGTPRAAA